MEICSTEHKKRPSQNHKINTYLNINTIFKYTHNGFIKVSKNLARLENNFNKLLK